MSVPANISSTFTPPAGKVGAVSSGPSSSASCCARLCWQSPIESANPSSCGSNMRRGFRTVARANEVSRRVLEFIVHAPLGKHEIRHANTIHSHSRRGGCGYSFRCLNQGRRANGGHILSSAHKARREKLMRYKHDSGPGRSPKSVASARPYRKLKSRKWQEIAIAAGITCSICLIHRHKRQIGFLIGGRHDQRFRHSCKSSSRF